MFADTFDVAVSITNKKINDESNLRGGFIEKHDWRIVDEFKSNGQTFLLSAGQPAASGVKAARESDAVENVLDLINEEKKNEKTRTMSVGVRERNNRYC